MAIWIIYAGVSIYGVSQLEVDFKTTYFISPDTTVRRYLDTAEKYFNQGETVTFYTNNTNLDYTSEETQLKLIEFNDKLKACEGCEKKWTVESSFTSWYETFNSFVQAGASGCSSSSYDTSKKIVKPAQFMTCLNVFLKSRKGQSYASDVLINNTTTNLKGFRQTIKLIYIVSAATDGVQVLEDLRRIESTYGIDKTFSFTQRFFDFESYVVFAKEAVMNVALALVAVFCVLMTVTANIQVSLFILFCVVLVDLFLFGLLSFWDVTLNSVTIVNIVIAIGLAVDYSAHIGHSYLTVDPPAADENGVPLTDH